MNAQLSTKRILIFLAIAVGVPWTAALVIFLSGMLDRNPLQAASLANIIAVSTPLVANIATRLITKEGFGHLWLRPNFRRGCRFYLAAWLLPALAAAIGCSSRSPLTLASALCGDCSPVFPLWQRSTRGCSC